MHHESQEKLWQARNAELSLQPKPTIFPTLCIAEQGSKVTLVILYLMSTDLCLAVYGWVKHSTRLAPQRLGQTQYSFGAAEWARVGPWHGGGVV